MCFNIYDLISIPLGRTPLIYMKALILNFKINTSLILLIMETLFSISLKVRVNPSGELSKP